MIAALCNFLALLAAPILGQDFQVLPPPSPCPTVFTYDPPGTEPGWWSGVVVLSSNSLLHSLWLEIVLDSKALKLLHMMAEVDTEDFKIFSIEDEDMQVQPGIPISLRFFVQYDTNDEVPRLQTIRLNGIVICNALLAEEQTDSRLKTNINSNKKPVINQTRQSIYVRPDNKSDPGNISNTGNNFSGCRSSEPGQVQTQCGTPTLKSKWPWVVAVYLRLFGKFYHHYDCGGTLLTHRHVITAARCAYEHTPTHEYVRLANEDVMVYLGQQNLRTSTLGVQIRLVQQIIVSPDFGEKHINHTRFKFWGHNVALLVLHEPVTYTDWVRPVCLWPANEIYLDSVIGKKGWLIGWDFDGNDVVIEQLSEVELPVVSYEMCNKSKDYLIDLDTYNFYCAGNREDVRACIGNRQGNGMYFKMGSSWYLRGQFTARKFIMTTCDPTKYFGFTDVAQSVPWIHSIISSNI